MHNFLTLIPDNAVKIILLLGVSFLIGLEREEEKHTRVDSYFFGGVRTYPLIAAIGFLLVVLAPMNMVLFATGFFVIGAFLVVSYLCKIRRDEHGMTSEMAGLITYLVGGAIAKDMYWIAVTMGIMSVLLLQMKTYLENIAKRIEAEEITTLVKFLLLSGVMLPVIPNQAFTQFHINPYKTWLIVVAVSSISYGSYLMEKLLKVKQSTLISGLFGGLYSSTATTVVLSKKAKQAHAPRMFSGAIVIATSMMYLRMAVLLFIFNREIFYVIGVFFLQLAVAAFLIGLLWAQQWGKPRVHHDMEVAQRNPLEVRTALIFASLFLLILVVTNLVLRYFGSSGVFSLAALIGAIDVDPFIMGLTQAGGAVTTVTTAAIAVVIASASNNIAKGIYSLIFADRKTGVYSFCLLLLVSVLSCGIFFIR